MTKAVKRSRRTADQSTGTARGTRSEEIRAALERGESPPAMYRVSEVARMLQLSRAKVYEMAAAGTLPSVKFGDRIVRIPAAELRQWIDARRRGEA